MVKEVPGLWGKVAHHAVEGLQGGRLLLRRQPANVPHQPLVQNDDRQSLVCTRAWGNEANQMIMSIYYFIKT